MTKGAIFFLKGGGEFHRLKSQLEMKGASKRLILTFEDHFVLHFIPNFIFIYGDYMH